MGFNSAFKGLISSKCPLFHENSGGKKREGSRAERFELTSRSVQRCQYYLVQGGGLLPFAVNVRALVGGTYSGRSRSNFRNLFYLTLKDAKVLEMRQSTSKPFRTEILLELLDYPALGHPSNLLLVEIHFIQCQKLFSVVVKAMRRLTTGIRSKECVLRRFRHCANIIGCTYTNLDSIAYYRYASLNDGDTFQ